jgi:ribosomal-protein-alanine N-acetyltransferase
MLNLNFTPFPNLTTARLLLRQLNAGDDNEIFRLRSNDSVNKYLNRPKANSIDEARAFINKINNGIQNNESLYWGITHKENSTLIGTICLWNISKENGTADIGYELIPEYQGKGIMQEALLKVAEFGFNILKLKAIEACTHPGNEGSIKLLTKNDFKKIKDADGESEEAVYALTKG